MELQCPIKVAHAVMNVCQREHGREYARDQIQLARQCQSFLVCFKSLPVVAVESGDHAEMTERSAHFFRLVLFSSDLQRPGNMFLHPSELTNLHQRSPGHQHEIHIAVVRGFANPLNTLLCALKDQQQ